MKRLRLLAASAAILLPGMAANAQQMMLSETDMFALYCFGILKTHTEGFDLFYPKSCPTGQERGCDADRAAIEKKREALNRVLRYITARGYSGTLAAGVAEQVHFTANSGASDARKCLTERLDNLGAGRRTPPPVCALTQQCDDLSRLPM
jgi:hypothetical protein